MRMSAALVTSFPVRARPSSIARSVEPRLVVRLAHPREHEDLVVHREAEEEREDHQRDPRRDRLRRRDVPERRAVALLEDEDDDPVRRAERDEVEDRGLDRQHDRAERARQEDERQEENEREDVDEVPVDGVDEVAVDGRQAAERRARFPCKHVLTRSMISWIPGAAPSIAGNASTSVSCAAVPARPGRHRRADDAGHVQLVRRDGVCESASRARRA